jgi:hypothetical protein
MRTRSKLPSVWLSAAISRSPCSTLMPTCVWLSAAVENTCDFFVGMVVFLQQMAGSLSSVTPYCSLTSATLQMPRAVRLCECSRIAQGSEVL